MRELVVIYLYAVVQVDVHALVGQRVDDGTLPIGELVHRRTILISLAVVGGAVALVELADLRVDLLNVFAKILSQNLTDRTRRIAVHVNKHLEAALGAREHPIDGALSAACHLVGGAVVLVEILHEVLAQVLAQYYFSRSY